MRHIRAQALFHLLLLICVCHIHGYGPKQKEMKESMTNFAWRLWRNLENTGSASDESTVVSPISIHLPLAMLRSGLTNQSLAEVEHVLEASQLKDRHFGQLRAALANESSITCVNRLYVDRAVHLRKRYKASVALQNQVYSAEQRRRIKRSTHSTEHIRKTDFVRKPEVSRQRINRYVERKTNGEITDLMEEGTVDSATLLVLVNALTIKAKWKEGFEEGHTKTQPFTKSNGEVVEVMMMMKDDRCFYTDTNKGYKITSMDLEGGALRMFFLIPDKAGNFDAILQQKVDLPQITDQDMSCCCSMHLPKFNTSYRYPADAFKTSLKAMGLERIFKATRDYGRMLRTPLPMEVSSIQHQARIEVNESGIKAVAATALSISLRMIPTMVVMDKPFMYILTHQDTGAVLMMGKYVGPS